MKAIVQDRYGSVDDLKLVDVPKPQPAPGEVLVQVRATSVHADIWHAVAGIPRIMRATGSGLRRPRHPVPGIDLAGTVEDVGARVTRFAPGDAVFGQVVRPMQQWMNGGTFAEFAVAPEAALAIKPQRLSFEEAAAIPAPGLIALDNTRGPVGLGPGSRVLVNGAGGAVGGFAVQIAKADGAHVTGVDGPEKQDLMRTMGADEVLDYQRTDVLATGEQYHLIVDIPMSHSFAEWRRLLLPDGQYVAIGHDDFGRQGKKWLGSLPAMLGLMARTPFTRQLSSLSPPTDFGDRMDSLADLVEAGHLRPVIDRTYPLSEASAALHHLMDGSPQGRVVITV